MAYFSLNIYNLNIYIEYLQLIELSWSENSRNE